MTASVRTRSVYFESIAPASSLGSARGAGSRVHRTFLPSISPGKPRGVNLLVGPVLVNPKQRFVDRFAQRTAFPHDDAIFLGSENRSDNLQLASAAFRRPI